MTVTDTPPAAAPAEQIRTVFEFELPIGYVDREGRRHRKGRMRMATARDEIAPLGDPRVRNNEAYLTLILLGRVVESLGTVDTVDDTTIEDLFAPDLAFLQDLYRRINQEGHTHAAVSCPSCQHEFTVDVTGGAPGES